MSEGISLIFSEEIDIERFLDVVEELGGRRHPDQWTAGRIWRSDRGIWIFESEELRARAATNPPHLFRNFSDLDPR